jgi:TolB-like protein/DNA-binding winged helix-turn-helix (wHTH) protein/Tfp pilus assembly protein PilF
MGQPTKQFYEFGPFRLDPVERLLYRDGEVAPLTAKIFDILLVFVRNSGRTLEKEEMMREVWPDQLVEEGNLTRNVSTLRKALGESPDGARYILTIPGRGYRFVAEVREIAVENGNSSFRAPVASEVTGDDAEATGGSRTLAGKADRRRITYALRIFALALTALAIAAVAYALFIRERRPSSHLAITSLVVLPLENLSCDPTHEYFADGMTDALIGDLAKIGALRVISRTSAARYKGVKKSLPEIAGELKVDAVVEGTVQRSGDRILIRAQLIHAATDQHLWAESYERDLRDALKTQSEVAQAIAREIKVIVTPQERARLAGVLQINPEAYEDYLKARYVWNKRTPESMKKAVEHFERAINLDPNYAPAYAGLADSYSMLSDYAELPPHEAYPKAKEAAMKALSLDDELAEAHTSLAWINAAYEWKFEEAEKEFQRAIAINPGYETARQWRAEFLSAMGRHEEAIAEIKRAQWTGPFSLIVNTALAGAFYFARQDDRAIAECQRVIELDPNFGEIYSWLQRAYEHKGMAREALAAQQKLAELMGWGTDYVEKVRRAESVTSMQAYWRKRLALEMEDSQPFSFWVAECWAQLGAKDQAFLWLEKLCLERSYWAIYLNVVPTLDPLRSDPRFTTLLRRVGLPQAN